jgi:hypothetical protein
MRKEEREREKINGDGNEKMSKTDTKQNCCPPGNRLLPPNPILKRTGSLDNTLRRHLIAQCLRGIKRHAGIAVVVALLLQPIHDPHHFRNVFRHHLPLLRPQLGQRAVRGREHPAVVVFRVCGWVGGGEREEGWLRRGDDRKGQTSDLMDERRGRTRIIYLCAACTCPPYKSCSFGPCLPVLPSHIIKYVPNIED